MADVFEEVEEELRFDRYRSIGRRLLPWLLGALALGLAVALAFWGWHKYRTGAAAKASAAYQQGLDAVQAQNPQQAAAAFTRAAEAGSPAYSALALMNRAGLALSQDKTAESVSLLDEAAAAADSDVIGDAARLKAALLLMDTAPYAQIETRLRPLTEEGRPYRLVAREALAMALLQAGRAPEARREFVVLSANLDASESMRGRARAAMDLIDSGGGAALARAAKAAPAAAAPASATGASAPAAAAPRPAGAAPAAATPPAAQPQTPAGAGR